MGIFLLKLPSFFNAIFTEHLLSQAQIEVGTTFWRRFLYDAGK